MLFCSYGANRGEGGAQSSNAGTAGFQPGRPTSTKKEPLKFDNDYDFEQANEEFKEFLSKFEVGVLSYFKDNNCLNDDTTQLALIYHEENFSFPKTIA